MDALGINQALLQVREYLPVCLTIENYKPTSELILEAMMIRSGNFH
jgi:hypothetical protein